MTIIDRYATAIRSSNLGSKPETVNSDSDVIGAAGLAAKRSPLAIALLRLFCGDNHASTTVVGILADKAVGKAYRMGNECSRVEAWDISAAVLAWHRDGTCKVCGGHGVKLIPGTTTLGGEKCASCANGRIRFDAQFPMVRLDLARWLAAELDREQAIAGADAMRALAPKLEL